MLFKNMYVCACIIHGVCLDSHSLAHCACVTGCVFVSVYFFAISCQILCVGLCVCVYQCVYTHRHIWGMFVHVYLTYLTSGAPYLYLYACVCVHMSKNTF